MQLLVNCKFTQLAWWTVSVWPWCDDSRWVNAACDFLGWGKTNRRKLKNPGWLAWQSNEKLIIIWSFFIVPRAWCARLRCTMKKKLYLKDFFFMFVWNSSKLLCILNSFHSFKFSKKNLFFCLCQDSWHLCKVNVPLPQRQKLVWVLCCGWPARHLIVPSFSREDLKKEDER